MGGRTAKHVLNIRTGETIWYEGELYTIQFLVDFQTALVKSHADGLSKEVPICDIRANKEDSDVTNAINLIDMSEKDWALCQQRYEVIKPLLHSKKRQRSVEDVKARAEKYDVGMSTVYRWIEAYENSGLLSSLGRARRSDKGRTRIVPEAEAIINDVIQERYLDEQRITISATYEEVQARCRKMGIKAPHQNTIRARVLALPEAKRVKERHGRQVAKSFDPIKGQFPGADWPLSYVQIDHTPLDIILVDDETRLPIQRPFITLALDVFSRMVAGFYLSFDSPSVHSVGMCISNAVLPKDALLSEYDLSTDWPIQGKMKVIHVDNALEFRSNVLARACSQHQIDIHWRPVREAQYGGHVERVFRTINTKIHELPGTTFSSVEEREYYNSEKYSAFTLKEFEKWLATFIVDKYHHSYHSEINTSPINRYEQGILGDSKAGLVGVGMPPRVLDQESFRIDFLPYVKRTIQNYGMRNEKIFYYHDVLRPWINAKENDNIRRKRRFVFHYDPRDISKYYFWDPELKQYFTIPYRDNRHPPISMWELREANKQARKEGIASIDEDILFDAYDRLKQITADAVRKTNAERKKQRRDRQRKKEHERARVSTQKSKAPLTIVDSEDDEFPKFDVKPFGYMKE